jgi:hypothetical protein
MRRRVSWLPREGKVRTQQRLNIWAVGTETNLCPCLLSPTWTGIGLWRMGGHSVGLHVLDL